THAAILTFTLTATSPTQTSTLSLHDALPICTAGDLFHGARGLDRRQRLDQPRHHPRWEHHLHHHRKRRPHTGSGTGRLRSSPRRSEEHTSELQSRSDLVCRLLLEKKKNQ